MESKLVNKVIEEYDLDNIYYTNNEWLDFLELNKIKTDYDENRVYKKHNYNKIDTENYWNGEAKNLLGFDPNKNKFYFGKSDYYTILTIKDNLLENVKNYRRDAIINRNNISKCVGFGVFMTTIIDIDGELKYLYYKRSESVGKYPNRYSMLPEGGFQPRHSSLSDAVDEEFHEELLAENKSLAEEIEKDYYYTGFSIDPIFSDPGVAGIIYVKDGNKLVDNLEINNEVKELHIEKIENMPKYNSEEATPLGTFSRDRAKYLIPKIREIYQK